MDESNVERTLTQL